MWQKVELSKRFSVAFTDRKRVFNVAARDHREAVEKAAGQRLYSTALDHRQEDRHGNIEKWVYRCNIRAGRTIRGSTPVSEVRAYVYPS